MIQPSYIHPLLDLSTAHMPDPSPDFGDIRVHAFEYGYVVWVTSCDPQDDELDEGVEGWLLPILKLARKHHCTLILFDRDASTIDGLETWDW